MIIPQKYMAVNWTDGMKINKEHFIDTEHFLADQIRDTASLLTNNHTFGVLPPLPGSGASLSDYTITQSGTQQLNISISHYHAITPGGVRIHIAGETLESSIKLSQLQDADEGLKPEATEYFSVVLVVNLHEKIFQGNPDPEEIPIRQPYTRPMYKIQVVAENSLNFNQLGAYHLVVGRLKKNGNDISKDDVFIPPAVSVVSNEKLKQHYKNIVEHMADIQNLSQLIVQKVNSKSQKSPVAQNIRSLCTAVLNYCASHYFSIRNQIPQQSPIALIDAMAQLSNHVLTFVRVLPESEKEEMLNYFFEWSDITPVLFTDKLSQVIDIHYNHHNNGIYFAAIHEMLNNLIVILQRLNTLEYIGVKRENIVVKEEVFTRNKNRTGWNILD
jgi:predicted component of type VI protein secretion system